MWVFKSTKISWTQLNIIIKTSAFKLRLARATTLKQELTNILSLSE